MKALLMAIPLFALPMNESHTTSSHVEKWMQRLDAAVASGQFEAAKRMSREERTVPNEDLTPVIGRMTLSKFESQLAKARIWELWAAPILVTEEALLESQERQRQLQWEMQCAMTSRVRAWSVMTTYEGLVPLDWITAWGPEILRAHLHRQRPGEEMPQAKFEFQKILLPDETPRLAFSIMAVGYQDIGYTGRHAKPNGFLSSTYAPAGCGKPAYICDAIANGLVDWIGALNMTAGIRHWDIDFCANSQDVLRLSLWFMSQSSQQTTIDLRMHQIGRTGLDRIANTLNRVSPRRPDLSIANS